MVFNAWNKKLLVCIDYVKTLRDLFYDFRLTDVRGEIIREILK